MGIPFRKIVENGNPWTLVKQGDYGSAAADSVIYGIAATSEGLGIYSTTQGNDIGIIGIVSGLVVTFGGYLVNSHMVNFNNRLNERYLKSKRNVGSL